MNPRRHGDHGPALIDPQGRPLRASLAEATAAPVTTEIATTRDGRDITRPYIDALGVLPPADPILRLRGATNYAPYEEILRDDQVQATFAQRRLAVVSKPTQVIPGGERRLDKQAAAFIEDTLTHIRWDTVTDRMLYGRFYGYAIAEALWARDGHHIVLDRLKVRNRRRFVFGPDFRPKLVTVNQPNGESLPEKKFWWFSTGADHDDEPYGLGLAHWLYWPVTFKRAQTGFWLISLEKFGQPTVVGKHDRSATEAEKRELLRATQAPRVDAGLIHPNDMEIELLEATRSGSIDYAAFYDHMDAAISKVVVGQTMTTDDGASKSQASVHLDVRADLVAADARLIGDSFNRSIVRWLTDWNFPGAAYPAVTRDMAEAPDLKALAERDEIVIGMMGARPDAAYIEQAYGLTLAAPVPAATPDPAAAAQFADTTPAGELEPLEQALDAIDAEDWAALATPLIQPILEQAKAEPEALMETLATLYPELDTEALTAQLTRLIFAADTWGRLNTAVD